MASYVVLERRYRIVISSPLTPISQARLAELEAHAVRMVVGCL
jgi:hypothetical protein